MRGFAKAGLWGVVLAIAVAGTAHAEFPYPNAPSDPGDYTQYRLPDSNARPSDLTGKLTWMYSAKAELTAAADPTINRRTELFGVRGGHLVDETGRQAPAGDTAWETTTGRPDVTIAVLDSGIKWNDAGAMTDLRKKTRLSRGEVPVPRHDRSTADALEPGVDCAAYRTAYDANGDGVFNVVDYACDTRVERDPAARVAAGKPAGVGPSNMLDPQDVLIAFTNGDDADGNGFEDDIVGWDFLDDDNDPFDDVQYGHGTGEARDSTAEANNGGELGTCANCMSIHMRVGDSFIADVNDFAQATIYATDNDVLVVQEALGTLNNSKLGRQAIEYAYEHGVTVIASAADEAAQHHNWPSSNPHVILVNSVTKYDSTEPVRSYLYFNGCTNFSSKITVAIPSVSCSSDATGRGSGMAGLIYSAALNARENGDLGSHPDCRLTDGRRCAITPNEVRQLMASGKVGGTPQSDDVNFVSESGEDPFSCTLTRVPACTDPNTNAEGAYLNRPVFSAVPTRSYPARRGHDQFYGWGRVNMDRAVDTTTSADLPPEVEITAPDWFEQVDPARESLPVRAQIGVREGTYTCRVLVAPGSSPNNTDGPKGDFVEVPSGHCNGTTQRSDPFDGVVASIDVAALKARFPANTGDFRQREPGVGTEQGPETNGRPNTEPYGFTIKVVASRTVGPDPGTALTGEDRRNLFLHRDQEMLDGFPKRLTSDGAASPLFIDLDGDNRNELVLGTSDGFVHAYRRDGSELDGWPVRGDRPALHLGGRAFAGGHVTSDVGGAILPSPAAADIDRDGVPEVVAADLEGKLYVWNAAGERVLTRESKIEYSGKPLTPFADVRYDPAANESKRRRTQHSFLGSPVLANIDDDDELEIVIASMDRHVYAWNGDGSAVDGFPVLVVDPDKVASIDPQTHAVDFDEAKAGDQLNQGAIITTPAIGNIDGDADSLPEIMVGTNEAYGPSGAGEGPPNHPPGLFTAAGDLLNPANTRLYAIKPEGDADGDGNPGTGPSPFVAGWPVKVAILGAETLPVVGEGMTGSAVVSEFTCPSGGAGPKVGAMSAVGPAYVFNANGSSCYGKAGATDVTLQSDAAPSATTSDRPVIPAFGQPVFGKLGAPGMTMAAPATGLKRALDVGLNDYQLGGQDMVAAWAAESPGGAMKPNFPARVNDLQFLNGPAIADIDAFPGGAEEILEGSAHNDLAAYNAAGAPVSDKWPKTTSDWMVTTPAVGSFGTLDTNDDAKRTVVAVTRSGSILAYGTPAGACAAASWPKFHHDNANSGDTRRDATAPGKPFDVSLARGELSFLAPGDDLLCGTAARYEMVTSNEPITASNFKNAEPLDGAPTPLAAGKRQSFVPRGGRRYIAIRAIDDQGNIGRPAVVDRAESGSGGGSGAGQSTTGDGPGGGSAQGGQAEARSRCLPRAWRLHRRGIGRIKIGMTRAQVTRVAGPPRRSSSRAMSWCATGGGRTAAALSAQGRVALVATTARGRAPGNAARGSSVRRVERVHGALRRIGRGLLGASRRGPFVFGVRGTKVLFAGVAPRGMSRGQIARHLRLVGLR